MVEANLKQNQYNNNLLNNNLFVIYDLKSFTSTIENKGYEINQGPQKEENLILLVVSCLALI